MPEVFDRVQLRRFRREWQNGDVFGQDEIVGHVPACLIHDEDSVRGVIDVMDDFGQMLGHCVGVAPWHDQRRRLVELWADCAKDAGRPCALIVGC